jgi:hypothetical protein
MKKYFEVTIQPASGGFGEFQRSEINGEAWASESDLMQEIESSNDGEVYWLGRDDLPASVEDIRGRIHNQPDTVFAVVRDDGVSYHGIVELDTKAE